MTDAGSPQLSVSREDPARFREAAAGRDAGAGRQAPVAGV